MIQQVYPICGGSMEKVCTVLIRSIYVLYKLVVFKKQIN